MDLGVISIQLEGVEVLNMNDIIKEMCVWSIDKTRLCRGPHHHGILLYFGEKIPTWAWYFQFLEFHSLTLPTVLRSAQNPFLGLAKMLCSGSSCGMVLCYHLLMGF